MFNGYQLFGLAAAVTMTISSISVVAQGAPVSSGPKATVAGAKPPADETAELAKATQSPVARRSPHAAYSTRVTPPVPRS
jgi:hypothetical protein